VYVRGDLPQLSMEESRFREGSDQSKVTQLGRIRLKLDSSLPTVRPHFSHHLENDHTDTWPLAMPTQVPKGWDSFSSFPFLPSGLREGDPAYRSWEGRGPGGPNPAQHSSPSQAG
jgi:hypothetical protein